MSLFRIHGWLVVCSMLLLMSPSPALAGPPKKPIVAVFDIQAKQVRIKRVTLRMLSDYLATRLAASGAYRVIPRSQLRKSLVAQKKKSYKLCYAQSCQIAIGRELAASKSLAARLMKIGRKCMVTATLYDLRSSTTDKAATAQCKCREEDFITCIDVVVRKLSGPAVGVVARLPPSASTARSPGLVTRPRSPVVRGVMDKEVIRRIIRRHTSQVQRCYQKGLRQKPDLKGRVVVEFTIAKTGHVVQSSIKQSTLGHTGVEQCIARAARGWIFPKPLGGGIVIVAYPFVLRTSDPPAAGRAAGGSGTARLTRSQIQKVMVRLAGPLRRQCFKKYRGNGLLNVQLVIQSHGGVSDVAIKGRFAGTPLGSCVVLIARRAQFPRFSGKPITITYPYVLR